MDALLQEVRESKILTGNDLAQLGALLEMPNETDVNDFKLMELSELFIEHEGDGVVRMPCIHSLRNASRMEMGGCLEGGDGLQFGLIKAPARAPVFEWA